MSHFLNCVPHILSYHTNHWFTGSGLDHSTMSRLIPQRFKTSWMIHMTWFWQVFQKYTCRWNVSWFRNSSFIFTPRNTLVSSETLSKVRVKSLCIDKQHSSCMSKYAMLIFWWIHCARAYLLMRVFPSAICTLSGYVLFTGESCLYGDWASIYSTVSFSLPCSCRAHGKACGRSNLPFFRHSCE